jgi:hypothetical protein
MDLEVPEEGSWSYLGGDEGYEYEDLLADLDVDDMIEANEEAVDGLDGNNASVAAASVPYPTLPVLYDMKRFECGTTESTEKGFKSIQTLWSMYCADELHRPPFKLDPPPGLGLYDQPELITTRDPNEQLFDRKTVEGFFMFLADRQEESTSDTMTKAKTFLNSHLKCEFYALLKSKGMYAYIPSSLEVGKTALVKQCVKAVNEQTATQGIRNQNDALALVDSEISEQQSRTMLRSVYCPKPGGRVAKLNNLYKLEFAAIYNTASATARRGEVQRGGRLAQRFVTQPKGLGPDPGLLVSCFLTDKGKTNQVGRVEYTGAAPHFDALRDVSAAHGMLHLYRFLKTAENFPNFLDYKDYMAVPTLPSVQNPRMPVGPTTFSANYTSFFEDAQVIVNKKSHQQRGQALRDMENNGVHPSHGTRLAGNASADINMSRAQKRSYLTPPPVPAMTQRAGGDPHFPRSHCPPWITVFGVPLEKVLLLIIPQWLDMQKLVDAEYNACTSMKEKRAGRWCSAKKSLDSMIHDIRRAFQMLASRPICPDTGILLADQPTYRSQFKDGVFYELLSLPVFESDDYKDFESRMRIAQDQYFAAEVALAAPVRNELDQILKARVDDRLSGIARSLHFLTNAVSSLSPVIGSGSLGGAADRQIVSPLSPGLPSRLQPSLPAHEDTLANGSSPRKKRRAISQQDIVREQRELARVQGSYQQEALDDRACTTLRQYWQLYKTKWLPLEQETNGEWRKDFKTPGLGRIESRREWWSRRSPMFALVNHYINSSHLSEEDALIQADIVFCSVPISVRIQMRPIKKLQAAFRAKLKELGVASLPGRPRSKKKRRGNNGNAFAAAFP